MKSDPGKTRIFLKLDKNVIQLIVKQNADLVFHSLALALLLCLSIKE